MPYRINSGDFMADEKPPDNSFYISEQSGLNEIAATMEKDIVIGFRQGSTRARSWRTPPNWSFSDWRDELLAVAISSAWQAKQDFDPSRGVSLADFVSSRIKARALTRYRQEWKFALNTVLCDAEIIVSLIDAEPMSYVSRAAFESLALALEQIPRRERWLLDQIFWQDRTEADIADELRISQPAVSKRKRVALLHLQSLL
jgi:RNA polymerase sigma factor (sigma-70 family)